MQPNINRENIPALMAVLKKLGLSIPKVVTAQRYLSSDKYSSEEKAHKLFGLKKDEDISEFLEQRLNEDELKLLKDTIGI